MCKTAYGQTSDLCGSWFLNPWLQLLDVDQSITHPDWNISTAVRQIDMNRKICLHLNGPLKILFNSTMSWFFFKHPHETNICGFKWRTTIKWIYLIYGSGFHVHPFWINSNSKHRWQPSIFFLGGLQLMTRVPYLRPQGFLSCLFSNYWICSVKQKHEDTMLDEGELVSSSYWLTEHPIQAISSK